MPKSGIGGESEDRVKGVSEDMKVFSNVKQSLSSLNVDAGESEESGFSEATMV